MALVLKNFSLHLNNQCLIHALNMEIGLGNFVALAGNNGVGKTSFLRALNGSLPFSGEAFFLNEPINKVDKRQRTYLGQHNFLGFNVSVREFLLMAKYLHSQGRRYSQQEAFSGEAILEEMGATHLLGKMMLHLSGGEQQLVWLAQTLNKGGDFILLDEPCQGLDVKNRHRIYSLLSCWAEENNALILCSTHDIFDLKPCRGKIINLSSADCILQPLSEQALQDVHQLLMG